MRIGQDYDMHRLVKGQKLMLGGVDIPYERGLLGHSDADMLLHAVSDTPFSATTLDDTGVHFPNNGPTYNGAGSVKLLHTVENLIHAAGYEVRNIDSMVVYQTLKFASHIGMMHARIAEVLALSMGAVSVKVSGGEHMGFIGRGEGIVAHTAYLLTERTK